MRKKKTVFHAPYFVNKQNPFSRTVQAYCSNCDAEIKKYRQAKCEKCGIDIYWNGVKGTE